MARAIDRAEWDSFCAWVSQAVEGGYAEIEISSPSLGHQVETRWLPFLGITYDRNDDVFDIAVEGGMDHIVEHPRELYAEEEGRNVQALEIVDREGVRHLVRLKDALSLPEPY